MFVLNIEWKCANSCQSLSPLNSPVSTVAQYLVVNLLPCKRTGSQIDLNSCSPECDLKGLSTAEVCCQMEMEVFNKGIWVDDCEVPNAGWGEDIVTVPGIRGNSFSPTQVCKTVGPFPQFVKKGTFGLRQFLVSDGFNCQQCWWNSWSMMTSISGQSCMVMMRMTRTRMMMTRMMMTRMMSRVGGWLELILGRSLMVSPPTRGSGVSNPGRQYRQFDTSSSSIWDIGKKNAKSHFSSP